MNALANALRPLAIAVLLLCAVGCAGGGISSDGGPIGTGITSSVAGNVVAVVTATDATAQASAIALPAVEVSIDEVADAATTTDADGNFAIDGAFAGTLTLRFRSSGIEATQSIDVPAGALVVLADVVVAPGEIDAEAGRQVGFVARVVEADCAAGILRVDDDRSPPREFTVQLVDDTRFRRRDGGPVACADVGPGERVAIDGVFAPGSGGGEVVTALVVTVGAERGERPDVVEDIPFLGFVAAIRCAAGTLTVADESQRTRLRLTPQTTFARADGTPLACAAIAVGDRVAGLGRLRVRMPGTIEATSVVAATGAGTIEVRLAGAVVGKDCAAGVLQLDDGDAIAAVQIGPDTVVEPDLSCGAIPLGAQVRGLGRVRRASPDLILALQLRIRPPGATAREGQQGR